VQYEQIWAPWRLGYIVGDDAKELSAEEKLLAGGEPNCFLCHAAADGDDEQRLVVCRGAHSIGLLNRYPYNNGHLLVAPRRHLARLDQLDAAEQLQISQTVVKLIQLLERVLKPEGFNVGLNLGRAAGAGVPGHLHWHIVPRWSGDTSFMPAVSAVRVIPQSLEALWEALRGQLPGVEGS
jgi:ATP adenylyltransferase